MQLGLIIPGQQEPLRVFRRPLDGLPAKIDEELGVLPVNAIDPLQGHHDLLARPPVSCIDDQVTNRPRLVVDDEVIDMANLAVHAMDMMAAYIVGTAQM